MSKVVKCRDVGFDCNGVIKANTEQEALNLAAEHAKTVHNVKEITPEIVKKIKSVMKDE
jgi:predicted small metal-binding protein